MHEFINTHTLNMKVCSQTVYKHVTISNQSYTIYGHFIFTLSSFISRLAVAVVSSVQKNYF